MTEGINNDSKKKTGSVALEGEVTRFNKEKGIGMIHILTGKTDMGVPSTSQLEEAKRSNTVFFNAETLAPGTDIKDIRQGTRVSLNITIAENGPLAVNVKKQTY